GDSGAFELRIEPGSGVETFDLAEREVRNVPVLSGPAAGRLVFTHVGAETIREDLLDVGRAFERQVVQANQLAVLRDLQILLDEIGALLDRQAVGLDRVFGRIGRRPAMRDQDLFTRLGEDENGQYEDRRRYNQSPDVNFHVRTFLRPLQYRARK